MTDPRAPRRAPVLVGVSVLLSALVAVLALGPAAAASASLGSVPAQVTAYVANGGMVARLADVYGKNGAGVGIDFDETTKAGPISRVYEWTAARLSGPATDHPVQLTNNWVVPVTIAGDPVGLATIWINPQTVAPELADFAPSSKLATAMATVPPTAALVRDSTTHAWLALAGDTVTPLITGTSGLTKPAPVDSLKLGTASEPAPAPHDARPGLILAIGVVGVVVVVIVIALLLSRRRKPKGQPADAAAPVAPAEPAEAAAPALASEPAAIPAEQEPAPSEPGPAAPARSEPAPRRAPDPVAPRAKPAPRPRSTSASKSASGAKPATPVTKPAGSKPGGRTPTSAATSTRPPVQKPPGTEAARAEAAGAEAPGTEAAGTEAPAAETRAEAEAGAGRRLRDLNAPAKSGLRAAPTSRSLSEAVDRWSPPCSQESRRSKSRAGV